MLLYQPKRFPVQFRCTHPSAHRDTSYIYLDLVHPKRRIGTFSHPCGTVRHPHAGFCQVNAKPSLRTSTLRVAVTVASLAERHRFAFDLFGERVVFGCKCKRKHDIRCRRKPNIFFSAIYKLIKKTKNTKNYVSLKKYPPKN